MRNTMHHPLRILLVSAFLGGIFVVTPYVFAWTNPSQNPPGGSGAITADGSGNVGIGMTNPSQKLSVAGTVQSTSGGFQFPDGSIQTTAVGSGGGQWATLGSNIYNTNPANVGIGTNNPARQLTVQSTNNSTGYIEMLRLEGQNLGNGWERGLTFTGNGGYEVSKISSYLTGIERQLRFTAGGTLAMTVRENGNVGIGTTNPAAALDIQGGNGVAARIGGGGELQIDPQFSGASTVLYNDTGSLGITTPVAAPLMEAPRFFANPSADYDGFFVNRQGVAGTVSLSRNADDSVRLHRHGIGDILGSNSGNIYTWLGLNGNVGIGMTNPSQKLSVAGTVQSTSGGFQFPDGSVQTTAAGSSGQWNNSGSNIYSANSGNVGIGTNVPSAKLEVNGGTNEAIKITGGGDLVIEPQFSGQRTVIFNDYGVLTFTTPISSSDVTGTNVHSSNVYTDTLNSNVSINGNQVNASRLDLATSYGQVGLKINNGGIVELAPNGGGAAASLQAGSSGQLRLQSGGLYVGGTVDATSLNVNGINTGNLTATGQVTANSGQFGNANFTGNVTMNSASLAGGLTVNAVAGINVPNGNIVSGQKMRVGTISNTPPPNAGTMGWGGGPTACNIGEMWMEDNGSAALFCVCGRRSGAPFKVCF